MLFKLNNYGVSGNLLNWIKDFLTKRRQSVHINGECSSWRNVKSGVPQGSVLGPLLFLIYVDDVMVKLNCNIAMFADDIKIWHEIRDINDSIRFQQNINELLIWSKKWCLDFNISKCVVLQLNKKEEQNFTYFLSGNALSSVSLMKDLGVTICSSLKPTKQCILAANKSMSVMRRIKRTFKSIPANIFGKIYGMFVRPHLEYAVQAWKPHTQQDNRLLNNVQRRSTKLVNGLWNTAYSEREQILNLFPLSFRQTRGDLILAYNIIRTNNYGLKFDDFFTFATTNNLRGHPWKLAKQRCRTLSRQTFFSQRVVNTWNSLPLSVVSAPNITVFKCRLDIHLMHI